MPNSSYITPIVLLVINIYNFYKFKAQSRLLNFSHHLRFNRRLVYYVYMKRINKRDLLIQTGKQIIVQQGFKAAGLNKILTTAGVPKGSFYYYFSSKDDFGLAIIDSFAEKYKKKIEQILTDDRIPHLQRLRNYFESGIADMKDSECKDGCLMGNLAQELSAQNELFRDRLSQIFIDWQEAFAQCLQGAQTAGELSADRNVNTLAKFILASWQGAILQAKVNQSVEPMETFLNLLFDDILTN